MLLCSSGGGPATRSLATQVGTMWTHLKACMIQAAKAAKVAVIIEKSFPRITSDAQGDVIGLSGNLSRK